VCVCVCGRGVVEWSVGGVVGTGVVVVVVGEGVVGVGVGVGGRWMGRVSGVACVVGMGGRGGGVGWWWCVWVGRWRMAVVAVGGGAASACMGWGGVGSPWPPFSLTCKQRNAACDFARECFARHLARADGDAGGNTKARRNTESRTHKIEVCSESGIRRTGQYMWRRCARALMNDIC
jgi:hypothetical protein